MEGLAERLFVGQTSMLLLWSDFIPSYDAFSEQFAAWSHSQPPRRGRLSRMLSCGIRDRSNQLPSLGLFYQWFQH